MAKLYFRYGAMNSGKSTILLQTAHNYEERGMKVIVVKPSKDLKADGCVESRLGATREVDILLYCNDNIFEIVKNNYNDVNCILVDEGQFLEPFQVDELMKITVYLNIPVICYGLRTDFKTNGFPGSIRLLELAHAIEEMKTICRCGRKAMFNARFVNGKIAINGDQVAIDGFDSVTYESMCPSCYYKTIDDLNTKVKKLK